MFDFEDEPYCEDCDLEIDEDEADDNSWCCPECGEELPQPPRERLSVRAEHRGTHCPSWSSKRGRRYAIRYAPAPCRDPIARDIANEEHER